MDTPDLGVIKDSQHPRPSVTPKSAAFGSPLATQASWTAPQRRGRKQQKPKASFFSDDDDDGNNDEYDQQNGRDAVANPTKQSNGNPNLDYISFDFDSGLNGETGEDLDACDQSPTPRASQAARLPPQSAQPAPRSNRTESSDDFEVFEALKKQSAVTKPSNDPFQITKHNEPPREEQQQAPASRHRPVNEGEKETTAKDTAPKLRAAARRSLANTKIKLDALELEVETEARKSETRDPREYDYSLPSSGNSSPAATPAKKRAPAKKQPVKRPAVKPKGIARGTKAYTGGRAKNTKATADSPIYRRPEAHSDEEQNQDMVLVDEPDEVIQAPQEVSPPPQMKERKLEPEQSPDESQKQDIDVRSSDSVSSFAESDNTDDEDFQYSRNVTPRNVRRRTRAAAAESAAAKKAKRKAESRPAALVNAQRQDAEDERNHLNAAKRPKIQPKQAPKKTTAEKTQPVTARSGEELKSSGDNSKEKSSASERTAPRNRTSKDNSGIKQKTVVSSNDGLGRSEADNLYQKSVPVQKAKGSDRKPNVIAFGPGGPKNNGKPHKKAAATDSRSRVQQPSPNKAEYPAATKSQLPKGFHKAANLQPNTVVQDNDSPVRNSARHAEGGLGQGARANRSSVEGAISDISSSSKDNDEETMPNFDAELQRPDHETDHDEASDQFVAPDAEAGSEDHQDHDMGNAFDKGDGMVSSPLAQADITHLHKREQRTVLGKVDANHRGSPRDVPAVSSRLMKRKLPDKFVVEERSPMHQAMPSETNSHSGTFPRLRMISKALNLPSEGFEPPVKKPRHNPTHAGRFNEDGGYGSNLVGGPGIVSRGLDDTGDDVFGPGKSGRPDGPSAFVQSLVSNESADRGTGQPEWVAPTSSDTNAAPRQNPISVSDAATARNAAPGVALRPQGLQQLDDVGKRMLAALEPEKEQVPESWPRRDEPSKSFPMGDPTKTWLGDVFDQRRASDMDERTRVWKKATEPYDASLGETMHRIVNTILRGLKANEAAVGDVVKDYREDGKQVVQRLAQKHSKERQQVTRQQEQNRQGYVQDYLEARHKTGTVLGKLKSVEVDQMVTHVEDATANRLKQLLQTSADA